MFVGNAKPVQHLVDHNALRVSRLLIFMMELMVIVRAMVLVIVMSMMMVASPCLHSLDFGDRCYAVRGLYV